MSDVRKGKPEARVAGKVPSFVTVHVTLINLTRAEEGKMWIDQQHRVAGLALRRRDDPPIRADVISHCAIDFRSLQITRQSRVSSKAVLKIVVADEGEREPRLDFRE